MVRVICYNIEYCEGIEGIWYQYLEFWRILFPPKNLDKKIISAIKKTKPDVLALIEVDIGSFRSRGKDEVKFICRKLKINNFVEKIKYPFNGWLKLFHYVPILNKQANAVASRYKLFDVKYHIFNEGTKRLVIEASIKCPKKVTFLITHLALGKKTRKMQIEELIKIVNNIKNPVILMGDFNTFNGEEEIQNILKNAHLKDKIKIDKEDIPLTSPVWHPLRRLDYILVSKDIKVKNYKILNFPFSDHLPLLIDFELKN